MYRISKRFAFSASHQLGELPEGHPCARLHGHNYEVEVELAAESVDGRGMVFDYGDLRPLRDYLDGTFDHRHLNDLFDFNPTAENLARHLYNWCHDRAWPVVAVRVSETPKTWAEYRIE